VHRTASPADDRLLELLKKIKGVAPPAALADAPYFLKEQKVGQNSLRDFTARLRRMPCSARLSQEPPNSLRSNMRRLFF